MQRKITTRLKIIILVTKNKKIILKNPLLCNFIKTETRIRMEKKNLLLAKKTYTIS